MLDDKGGYREKRGPARRLECEEGGNIAHVFDAGGNHLADLAYRPHEARRHGHGGLFLC